MTSGDVAISGRHVTYTWNHFLDEVVHLCLQQKSTDGRTFLDGGKDFKCLAYGGHCQYMSLSRDRVRPPML